MYEADKCINIKYKQCHSVLFIWGHWDRTSWCYHPSWIWKTSGTSSVSYCFPSGTTFSLVVWREQKKEMGWEKMQIKFAVQNVLKSVNHTFEEFFSYLTFYWLFDSIILWISKTKTHVFYACVWQTAGKGSVHSPHLFPFLRDPNTRTKEQKRLG